MKTKVEFLQKREIWLKEVADQCHEYALELDKDFYVFQSSSKLFRPDILLIGINPGDLRTYKEALKNIKQDKNEDRRNADNLDYPINLLVESGGDWDQMDNVRKKIKAIFHSENLFKYLENSVMMNMIYFNTKSSTDINNLGNKIINYCTSKTVQFAEIIEPRNIVFFTSDSTFLKKCGVTDIKKVGDFTKIGKWNNREVIAIPHFSARGYSAYDIKNRIGSELEKFLK